MEQRWEPGNEILWGEATKIARDALLEAQAE